MDLLAVRWRLGGLVASEDDVPLVDQTQPVGVGSTDDLPLKPGADAGDYVITDVLAMGGHGVVYSAVHRTGGQKVAVKILHASHAGSPVMQARLEQEAKAVALIRHPNIIDVFEVGRLEDGRTFLAMELVPGVTLSQHISSQSRISPAETLVILEPLCSALHAAHEANIVHRDLKASNVMIEVVDDAPRIKLLDFGIAKLLRPDPSASGLTSVGQRLGTPVAMAPEQIRGEPIDRRSDIYALGCLAYHMLTGRTPFLSGDPFEMEKLHLEAIPSRPSEAAPLSPAIDRVVMRCLEKKRENRFDSALLFLEALREAVQGGLSQPTNKDLAPAVAIYVEAALEGDADEVDDADQLLEDLATILDKAEAMLRQADFAIALKMGSSLLGVRLLKESSAHRERRDSLDLARRLHDAIGLRPGDDGRIRVGVCVHVDDAHVKAQPGAPGLKVVGGPILRVSAWASNTSQRGAWATPEATADLPDPCLPTMTR